MIEIPKSTPMGRIISRVSSDLSVIDIDLAMKFTVGVGTTMNTYFSFGILAFLTWPILFIIIPTVYVTLLLQVKKGVILDFKTHMYRICTYKSLSTIQEASITMVV